MNVTLNVAADDADCDVLVDVEPLRVRRRLIVFGAERVFDRELEILGEWLDDSCLVDETVTLKLELVVVDRV